MVASTWYPFRFKRSDILCRKDRRGIYLKRITLQFKSIILQQQVHSFFPFYRQGLGPVYSGLNQASLSTPVFNLSYPFVSHNVQQNGSYFQQFTQPNVLQKIHESNSKPSFDSPNSASYYYQPTQFMSNRASPSELKRPRSSSEPSAPSKISHDDDLVKMLCMLRLNKRDSPPSPSSALPTAPSTRGLSHTICPHCQKRNPVESSNPPATLTCFACSTPFPLVRRYLHDYQGRLDADGSLELPCLRGVSDPAVREAKLLAYTSTVLSGRRCSFSTQIREIQKLLSALVAKVDKRVTRELHHVEEECQQVVESLLGRVEQYCNGELHCHCLQPAFAQRHFIQCDVCDLWFHTSCVGVDSRKLAGIASFVCPWCLDPAQRSQEPAQPEEAKTCVCPLCDRVFPRPCNLSRHLHAKHSMKWHTHVMLHLDVNDYLEVDPKASNLARGAITHRICEGCYASEHATEEYNMTKSQFRFLLRKLRVKPPQWWVGKEVRVWDGRTEKMVLGVIKCIRPRSEFCIKLKNGSTMMVGNLFDPQYRIQLLILNGNFELELLYALPTKWIRDVHSDIRLFIK